MTSHTSFSWLRNTKLVHILFIEKPRRLTVSRQRTLRYCVPQNRSIVHGHAHSSRWPQCSILAVCTVVAPRVASQPWLQCIIIEITALYRITALQSRLTGQARC